MKRDSTAMVNRKIESVIKTLESLYPHAECALVYGKIPERLVIATILSAQTTDAAVNRITPMLWDKYPTMEELAGADRSDVERVLKSIGLFRNKTGFIIKAAAFMAENGLPDTIDELVKIPGVGRKTANVITGEVFGKPSITVDTHVKRLSGRLGLTAKTDPAGIEASLKKAIPPKEQTIFCHRLITHGRQVCTARKPGCEICGLSGVCNWFMEQKKEP